MVDFAIECLAPDQDEFDDRLPISARSSKMSEGQMRDGAGTGAVSYLGFASLTVLIG